MPAEPDAAVLRVEADGRRECLIEQRDGGFAFKLAQKRAGGDAVRDREGGRAPACRFADQRGFHEAHAKAATIFGRAHGDEAHLGGLAPQAGVDGALGRAGGLHHLFAIEEAQGCFLHHRLLFAKFEIHAVFTLFAPFCLAILKRKMSIWRRRASGRAEGRG